MSNIKKPTTVAMSDFKESLIQLLRGSELPAWVLLYIIEPYVAELRQVSKQVQVKEREEYEAALKAEEVKEKTEG